MAFLAMTIAQQTDVLLLDEPLNNLDMKHAVQIMRALRRLCDEQGRTVILVIHDINFAANYSDHIVALKHGALRFSGPVDEVVTEARLGELYELDFEIVPNGSGRLCNYTPLEHERVLEDQAPGSGVGNGCGGHPGGLRRRPRRSAASRAGAGRARHGQAPAGHHHGRQRAAQGRGAGHERGRFLDQLGVPIAGMTKDYVPHFLSKYKDAPDVQDLGAIVQPNLERAHALKPDLILITPIQANHYQELSEIAPTLHFDVDYKNSQRTHIATVRQHLLTLGRIFDKEALAQQKAAELDAKVEEARRVTAGRPEKAMIVMHNNGAFSAFGVQSRYAFVFDALGVRPASTAVETSLHGQPISSEFIQEANPDILYVVDRSAVMERRPVMDAERMANPLLRQTNAWKNGRVVFVDADAWYITAASVTSLTLLIDDVIKGYRR